MSKIFFYLMNYIVCCGLAALIGCSSNSDTPPPNPSGGDPSAEAKIISGTAAAGAPIVGIVNVKGVNGNTASSPIDIEGKYSIDVSELASPYILFAEGSVNGSSIKVFSASVGTGNINITPLTDYILRNAIGVDLENSYIDWTSSQLSANDLSSAETLASNQIAPLISRAGLSDDIDLISTPFDADHTGLDMVLEDIDISYEGDVATVTDILTGSQFVNDIGDVSDNDNGLPPVDIDPSTLLADGEAINQVFQILEGLYADSKPTPAELNEFAQYIADDFLSYGFTKNQVLDDWAYDEGPEVGMSLSSAILTSLDVSGTDYQKGYEISLYYSSGNESDNSITSMVYDGEKWLWWGDQKWLEIDTGTHAIMSGNIAYSMRYQTGLILSLDDDANYVYNQGVRSAVVSGPGLPAEGVIYQHNFPENSFKIYPLDGTAGTFYAISDDSVISTIPDNAEYTFALCSETADDLYNGDATCSEMQVYTENIVKSPVLNSELDSSMFASLTNPTSSNASELNFGGIINISWTVPENMISDDDVGLQWPSGSTTYWVGSESSGSNGSYSASFDTIGLPQPDFWVTIFVMVIDEYGREYNLHWGLF